MHTDDERLGFLEDLDRAAIKGVEVTDWEAKFIESQIAFFEENPKLKVVFSSAQRKTIDEMYLKYGSQI
jgi:hypothetical protein